MPNQEAAVHSNRLTRGSCLCGKISYEIAGEPQIAGLCHCKNCRKTSGAAFSSILVFAKDQIKVTGEENLHTYDDGDTDSGNPLKRRFCSNCGCPLFFLNTPETIILALGTANDPPAEWRPTMEVFNRNRVSWLPEIEGTHTVAGNSH